MAKKLFWSLSTLILLTILVGSLGFRVRAADDSYKQVSLFSEVLALVTDQYVDPVDSDALMEGAYEGLLSSLDAESAYLDEEGVSRWKTGSEGNVGVGIQVIRAYGALQIVDVESGSPADEAGLVPGDQIRSIDGIRTRSLSLTQAERRLQGKKGSRVKLGMLHPEGGFKREERVLVRATTDQPAFAIELRDDIAVLTIDRLGDVNSSDLNSTLSKVATEGAQVLLVDLRNRVNTDVRDIVGVAQSLLATTTLRRVDREGGTLESIDLGSEDHAWARSVYVLTNRATAGAYEALAMLLRLEGVELLGESTYGLGAEPQLFELESGGGLLVSASQWVDMDGDGWNEEGLEPDTKVSALGRRFKEARQYQLDLALETIHDREQERAKAAA